MPEMGKFMIRLVSDWVAHYATLLLVVGLGHVGAVACAERTDNRRGAGPILRQRRAAGVSVKALVSIDR